MLQYPRELSWSLFLYSLATVAGLVAPQLLGHLVAGAGDGIARATAVAVVLCAAVVAQAVLTRFALLASLGLGEKVLARLREEFMERVLKLPPATVEKAGSGELITRTTRDIDVLANTVQMAVPDSLMALATVLLTLGALTLTSPVLVLPCLIAVPVLWLSTGWYLRRARAGYLRAGASYAQLTGGLSETVEGAWTVDSLSLADRRFARVNDDIAESYAAERRTLYLRTVYLPIADFGYVLPVVATLLIGGLLYIDGDVTLAAVTTATLYVQQIIGPVDRLLYWMDELQVGGASFARILGVHHETGASSPVRRTSAAPADAANPDAEDIVVEGVHFAYREGQTALNDVTLTIRRGERVAIVGPSGAGKSTLGLLLTGIHAPDSGTITSGGRALSEFPLPELRKRIALVTQEQHVFRGTLRDNLRLARQDAADDEVVDALKAVDAWHWAEELGLDGEIGSGIKELAPAQAQQLALARLVLADPGTVVLDEATSLLDPQAARHLERALAAVLKGRTVIAVAHRLHTAHDADRVVVMDGGTVRESGTHDELVARGGAYARLWRSWHGGDLPAGAGTIEGPGARPKSTESGER
jgi:ABC-type multidrug transport system fused ATPase/permease subunit|uniref:ABC transporter ATP-binding protein n=1 Tax=Streptomyces sp. MSC1_001 TaxID=2909263 RepID=UPI002030809F|nr:ABC transporter ATP-binding protein [Streptomyces sp. MSC1_001]